MNRDELQLKIARKLYLQDMTVGDFWDTEQQHKRNAYLGMARNFLAAIDELGLEIVERPKVPESTKDEGTKTSQLASADKDKGTRPLFEPDASEDKEEDKKDAKSGKKK